MKVLRNTVTNEIFPMNGDMQLAENMEVVDVPDLSKARSERGNLVLEDNPNPSAEKRRTRKKAAPKPEQAVESAPETPEPVGESGGDDAS